MALVSPVFKALLQPSFKEGETLRSIGKVEIPLPDDDPIAFRILMIILHAQNHSVPRQVDLSLLTSIAVLVDKYELHNSVGIFADMWISALKQATEMPESFSQDLVSWICITWVFRKSTEFNHVTLVAQKEAMRKRFLHIDEIPGFANLPLPSKLIDKIYQNREVAMQHAFSKLEGVIASLNPNPGLFIFMRQVPQCPNGDEDCDAMLLGSILRAATKQKLWPIPEAPYYDPFNAISVTDLASKLRSLRIQSACGKMQLSPSNLDTHGVRETLDAAALALENSPQGLNLEDFS
ncbi:hypothetical protein LOCC1_G003392 [Lachnellula occidentalis]|uniref:BTB domain-containing protein n=1 Tax=Lachnellula occidentalis TaxID=215460 RepID=A0A8H8UJF9_9HELO|nr:hypothetical protein LOCC1_G003392 [Lachnellula occidentalis]